MINGNRIIVQIISSLIGIWALVQFFFTFNPLALVLFVACAYIWWSADWKLTKPRQEVAQWWRNKSAEKTNND